jgi:3alpha(or 20beta)-hydroxysteroid dehydrogenase
MGRLEGKVAVITGAARGQGEAEARAMVEEGASVLVGDVIDDLGEKVAGDLGDAACFVHLDVACADDWARAVDTTVSRFGKLDVLVNNAGITKMAPIETQPLDDYLAVVNINQVGCWLGMKAVIPAMKAAGSGVIVNTSSVAGLTGGRGTAAYTASKFAIRGMTKCAALELGRYNIRVNSVHPGPIDTPMLYEGDLARVIGGSPEVLWAQLPIRRAGLPEEVAKMVVFLVADATYSTGAEFVIDGGQLAGGH